MTKKMVVILIAVMVMLTGCEATVEKQKTSSNKSMFVLVEKASGWDIVYHKDTKVMYAVSAGRFNTGTFTVLVDAKGKPMLWEDE